MPSSTRAWSARVQPAVQRGLAARRKVRLTLHHGITSGVIPGGTRLVQSVIADEFAVSARQVHEALRDLAADGLVRFDPRGGAVVQELCRSDLEDIYQIRMLLEPAAAARSAVSASEDALLRAVTLLAAMESETDAGQWTRLDSGFHRVIGDAGGSPRLATICENLREASARYVRHSILAVPGRADESNAEHEAILRAVLKKDPAAAADAMFRHLDGTLSALRVHPVQRRQPSLTG
ncbi:MAG: GntR family transcriptional regulator [Nocardiopsaceae bacterium]|nr:GntR family transcriptional regulator [Nocardiopsaceae bacterium]